jgi:nicotinamidase/pyrazinamidase
MSIIHGFIIVDVQNDFCQGGALPVPDGNAIIPCLNKYIQLFTKKNLPIFATRDWHPKKTKHFELYGGKWPVHCVQNSWGAEFHPDLKLPSNTIIISAGMNPDDDGYSGFEGIDQQNRSLYDVLKSLNVTKLSIGGLATEYCVKATTINALQYGFEVNLLTDAIRGINIQPSDSNNAILEMEHKGAHLVTLHDFSI